MSCNNNNILNITMGNDFRIHVCCADVAPLGPEGATFADIVGLEAHLVDRLGRRTQVDIEVLEDGDAEVSVHGEIQNQFCYGIELTGTYGDHPWRWKDEGTLRLVDGKGNVHALESFGEDTYYINDVLDVWVEGNTLVIVSEGHAAFKGETLSLMATDDTTATLNDEELLISKIKNKIQICQ